MRTLTNIFWLGSKEIYSFLSDRVLLVLVIYAFTFAVYAQAQNPLSELHNAAIAIVDEDQSALSRSIATDFLPPYFKPVAQISRAEIDRSLDIARYTFVLDVPPHFQRDVLAGHDPALQVNVDATAAMQAGIGAGYIQQIVHNEVNRTVRRSDTSPTDPVALRLRIAFNPNTTISWFSGVMGIIGNVTILAIILTGAAVVREREQGTMDHLLMMPLSPFDIAAAKIAANTLVITVAVGFSLIVVVEMLLAVPVNGSIPLFMAGVVLYLFSSTAIGLYLGTLARSMPQLGLLFMLVALPLNLLSGSNTPLESMPAALQVLMQASPTTHFVNIAQSVLSRGAGLSSVWWDFLIVALMAAVFFSLAVLRFRKVAALSVG